MVHIDLDTLKVIIMEKRVEWIDSIKGLAIILVVLGHCGHSIFFNAVYYIHLPIFIIVSGYIISLQLNYKSSKEIIRRRIETIIWSYFTFGMMRCVLIGLKCAILRTNFDIYNEVMLIIGWENNANWFLPPLFIASIIFLVVNNKQENTKKLSILLSIISCLVLMVLFRNFASTEHSSWLLVQNTFLIARSCAFYIFMQLGTVFCVWLCKNKKTIFCYYFTCIIVFVIL